MKHLIRFVQLCAAFTVLLTISQTAAGAADAPKKILFFSKSGGYEHDMIAEKNGQPSHAQSILAALAKKHNFEFTFTKDGSFFTPENIAKYDAFFFYTQGDLCKRGVDGQPPMTPEGKAAFLEAIYNGKGFIGTHSASDTSHSAGLNDSGPGRWKSDEGNLDPYVKMLGGEFIVHGSQQRAHLIVTDKSFPGMKGVPDDFAALEEWYSLKNFSPDLHVLLVQDTSSMQRTGGNQKAYDRPNYPSTWAHPYGKGHVFYTSMGHRDDVWANPVFQEVLVGGINWAVGNVDADITPNLEKAAPQANTLPPGP